MDMKRTLQRANCHPAIGKMVSITVDGYTYPEVLVVWVQRANYDVYVGADIGAGDNTNHLYNFTWNDIDNAPADWEPESGRLRQAEALIGSMNPY